MDISIKAAPTFGAVVYIPIPGADPAPVRFEFKHRTRDEFAKFVKEGGQIEGVEYVLKVAVGWEFTDEFNKKNVATLLQNYHGAEHAIAVAYIKELVGARTKNS